MLERGENMKKEIKGAFLLFFLLVLCTMQTVSASAATSWYVVRNKAHRQPIFSDELAVVREYNAYYIDQSHADGDADKVVYFTFDAGYENGNVAKILNILKEKEVNSAFFVLKHLIEANSDLILRMEREGHTVCNHTAHHPDLSAASKERISRELQELEESYFELTGKQMAKYFRPPEGKFSKDMLKSVSEMGYNTFFWSFAYADWDNERQPNPQKALQCIMDNIHNGAIILLHPTSQTNVEILPTVIDELRAQGYRFGTLEELCDG